LTDLEPLVGTAPIHPSAADPPVAMHEAPGAALQVRVTPVAVVTEVELAVMATDSGLRRGTAIGTPAAIRVRLPLGLPVPVGAKRTAMAHCAVGASAPLQLLACTLKPLDADAAQGWLRLLGQIPGRDKWNCLGG
jgi:hypothetical protein